MTRAPPAPRAVRKNRTTLFRAKRGTGIGCLGKSAVEAHILAIGDDDGGRELGHGAGGIPAHGAGQAIDLEIGLGDKASNATGTGLLFAYNDYDDVIAQFLCPTVFSQRVGITGELLVDNQIKTQSNYFAGLVHKRQDTEMTVKVGTGKNIPMFNGGRIQNTASLELSNADGVRARLDLSESWGESCGVLTFQGYSFSNNAVIRSAPLELGQEEMWFNGKPIISTIQRLLDEFGMEW
jgi:hypothetical protein